MPLRSEATSTVAAVWAWPELQLLLRGSRTLAADTAPQIAEITLCNDSLPP